MSGEIVYERLAEALDRLPNRFPRTPSGVEIELLEAIFPEPDARIAGLLGETPESAAAIATRIALGPADIEARLVAMAEHGLVWPAKRGGELRFRLAPFAIGIYEAQLTRMSPELARLIDAYMEDGGAHGIMGVSPALHRVVPAQGTVKPEWILPYDDVQALLDEAKSFRVRDCVCRVQQDQVGRDCTFPLRTCLVYETRERAPSSRQTTGAPVDTPISKEEALDILDEAEEVGLVHTVSNVQIGALLPAGIGYVCNCCGCCCMVMRGITRWGIAQSVAHAAYVAVIDAELCNGCGTCAERCHVDAVFDVRDERDGAYADGADTISEVEPERCIGCGLCISTCPTGAAVLERRPYEECVPPPEDFAAWSRARHRRRARG